MEYTYAHNDTSVGERRTATAVFNKAAVDERLQALRENAFSRGIPTADDETLNFLVALLSAVRPKNILELGAAVGISGAVMLDVCKDARLTTVERDENFYKEACANFERLQLGARVNAVLSDAGEFIASCEDKFDFIFLDCAKVQYVKYLPRLKRLMVRGAVLLADDVLLYGWITGETEIPQKRKMLARHVREYIDAVTEDGELTTTVLNLGDGLAMSVKK